jgi:hypothetical protein
MEVFEMPVARNKQTKDSGVSAQEALDMFTVKRKQGKKSGQYEGVSIRMGNASYTPQRKTARDYVSPGDGGY